MTKPDPRQVSTTFPSFLEKEEDRNGTNKQTNQNHGNFWTWLHGRSYNFQIYISKHDFILSHIRQFPI